MHQCDVIVKTITQTRARTTYVHIHRQDDPVDRHGPLCSTFTRLSRLVHFEYPIREDRNGAHITTEPNTETCNAQFENIY